MLREINHSLDDDHLEGRFGENSFIGQKME